MGKAAFRTLASVIVLAAVLVAASVLVPTFLPAGDIARRLADEAERVAGHPIAIGHASLTLLPTPALELDDVTLASDEGVPLLSALAVRLPVSVPQLMLGRIVPTGLSVIRPVVTPESGPAAVAEATHLLAGLIDAFAADAPLTRFAVLSGRVDWSAVQGEAPAAIEGIMVDASLDAATGRLKLEGHYSGKTLTPGLALEIASVRELAGGGASDVVLSMSTQAGRFNFDGRFDAVAVAFDGHVAASTASMPTLARAFGLPSPPFADLMLEAGLRTTGARFGIADGRLVVGGHAATFSGSLDAGRPRLLADLRVAIDDLDLAEPVAANEPQPADRTDLPEAAALDIAWLSGLDGRLDLSIDRLKPPAFMGLPDVGPVKARLSSEQGTLAVALDPSPFAGGSMSGEATLTSAAASLSVKGRLKLDGAAITGPLGLEPALKGRVGADLAFAGSGRSLVDFASALTLDGRVHLGEGVIEPPGGVIGRIDGLEADFAFRSLDVAGQLTGKGRAGDRDFTFDASLQPRRLVDGGAVPLTLTLRSGETMLSFAGSVDPGLPSVAGALSVKAAAAADVAALVGHRIAGLPSGEFRIEGDLEAAEDHLRFSAATLAAGRTRGAGTFDVRSSPSPSLTARLNVDDLDFGALIGLAAGLDPSAPGGWTAAPLDWPRLAAVGLDIVADARAVSLGDLLGGAGHVELSSGDGVLNARLSDLILYGGKAALSLGLDGRDGHGVSAEVDVDGAAAGPVMKALALSDRCEGTLDLTFDVKGRGNSFAAALASLAGTGKASIVKGSVSGFQLASFAKAIGSRPATGFGAAAGGSQSFASASLGLAFAAGQGRTSDLVLDLGQTRLQGEGSVDFGKGTVDLALARAAGEKPPFAAWVSGDWRAPTVSAGKRLARPAEAAPAKPAEVATTKPAESQPAESKPSDPVAEAIDRLTGPNAAAAPQPAAPTATPAPAVATPEPVKPAPVVPKPPRRPAGLGAAPAIAAMPAVPTGARSGPLVLTPEGAAGAVEAGRALPPPCVVDASGKCVAAR